MLLGIVLNTKARVGDNQAMSFAPLTNDTFLRALLREPDLPRRLAVDPTVHSQCTHCNLCMPTIYTHTRCPVRTGEAIG